MGLYLCGDYQVPCVRQAPGMQSLKTLSLPLGAQGALRKLGRAGLTGGLRTVCRAGEATVI